MIVTARCVDVVPNSARRALGAVEKNANVTRSWLCFSFFLKKKQIRESLPLLAEIIEQVNRHDIVDDQLDACRIHFFN